MDYVEILAVLALLCCTGQWALRRGVQTHQIWSQGRRWFLESKWFIFCISLIPHTFIIHTSHHRITCCVFYTFKSSVDGTQEGVSRHIQSQDSSLHPQAVPASKPLKGMPSCNPTQSHVSSCSCCCWIPSELFVTIKALLRTL